MNTRAGREDKKVLFLFLTLKKKKVSGFFVGSEAHCFIKKRKTYCILPRVP